MPDVPYNFPSISGHTIIGFSKLANAASRYVHVYEITTRIVPSVSVRAGSITALQLSHGNSTQTVSSPVADNIASSGDLDNAPSDMLVFANVTNAAQDEPQSSLRMWCSLSDNGNVCFHLVVVGPGTDDGAAIHFPFQNEVSLKVTTGDVLNDNDDVILCGGDFTFPIRLVIFERDLPKAQATCFYEYIVGESVDQTFRMDAWCNRHEPVGDAYGGNFPESDIGGKIISPDNYWSGLKIETVEEYDDYSQHFYVYGLRIHGTASRPGVYIAHVYVKSNAYSDNPLPTMAQFDVGEDNNIIIISIRERAPIPGDPMLLIQHGIASVPQTYLSVTHCGHNLLWWVEGIIERDAYTNLAVPYNWTFIPSVWDESRPGGGEDPEFEIPPTGHLHHPGFWYRRHDWYTPEHPYHSYEWYVIVRDVLNDSEGETRGVWRLYCSSEDHADHRSWHAVASAPEIGLLNEYVTQNGEQVASHIEAPPKTWHFTDPDQVSQTICFKGCERCVVDGYGVFSHAGYLDIELPLPEDAEEDAEQETVRVEVFQQQPLFTPQYDGWSSLNFWPPEYQYASNKLLYDHPDYGFVMVDDLESEVSDENRVTAIPITHVGIPYAPAAPPMVIGGNANAIRRDIVLSDGDKGMSVSNLDGTGRWVSYKMVLLGGMAAAGYFNGGIIWPHYPLTRFVNFERLRMNISVSISVSLLGSSVGYEDDANMLSIDSSAYGNPAAVPADPGHGEHHNYGKHFLENRYSAKSDGTCTASIEFTDLPCWYNGYMLFCEIRKIPVSNFSGSVNTTIGTLLTETVQERVYWYDAEDEHARGWKLSYGESGSSVMYTYAKTGTLGADSCTCSIRFRAALGHGREVNLCPPKITGSDRPSTQVVFAGDFGVDCTWDLSGSGVFQQQKVESYTKQYNWGDGWYEDSNPPEDTPEVPTTLNLRYTVSRNWTTGLQSWKLKNRDPNAQSGGDANVIHASFDGEYRSYRQNGSYMYQWGNAGETPGAPGETSHHSASGECFYRAGDGSVSGRTTVGHEVQGQRTLYPLVRYDGYAQCHTVFDGVTTDRAYPENTEDADPNVEPADNDYYNVDPANTSAAANAKRAYNKYLKMVKECSFDAPAIADYRGDGEVVLSQYDGRSGGDHRLENITLTVSIQEN